MDTLPTTELDHLARTPLFKGLSTPDLQTVRGIAQIRKAEPDGYFFYQGDPAEYIYIVREGRVKITQINAEGQQILLRVLGPWDLFAVIALTNTNEYPVSAQAVDASQAFIWTKADLLAIVERIPKLSLNMMQLMANHIQEFQERYRELATERVERRLARTLLRLANQTGRKTDSGVLIDFPLSRQDLAEMTATTLFTVSRILSQWETQKIVLSGRERVTICHPHGLVRIAEDLP